MHANVKSEQEFKCKKMKGGKGPGAEKKDGPGMRNQVRNHSPGCYNQSREMYLEKQETQKMQDRKRDSGGTHMFNIHDLTRN